jgi:uncharacterized damage-inducible protein DinB
MIIKALLDEFDHEAESTRKLLNAIPDSALGYKPSEKNWTTGQLASHIAEVYNWFDGTFNLDVMEMSTYKYDKGDISQAANIVAKFEENVKRAREILANTKEENMTELWAMHFNGQPVPNFPAMPRAAVVRSFLFNHLYHHRGELVVYLRATGNKVPGMYGPTADDAFGG